MRGPDVQEVNINAVDLGQALTKTVELPLAAPPVITRTPVVDESLDERQGRTLRPVIDQFGVGPAREFEPSPQIVKTLWFDREREGNDCFVHHVC